MLAIGCFSLEESAFESNAVFGFAASPRVSAAYYLRRPASNGFLGDTKLKFNFGKASKSPARSNKPPPSSIS